MARAHARTTNRQQSTAGILAQVLSRIKPAGGIPPIISTTLSELNASISKKKLKATAALGGSFAKHVHLADDFDVDIFVQFDRKTYLHANLSDLLEGCLTTFKPTRIHGSRDYFQFCKGKIQFEIVPVLSIKHPRDAVNVTDCSPLHVAWVSKHIKKLHDEVRLAKQFFKAAGVYGAESYIRGFSGHVIDLLVIIHQGFLPLLAAASKWKPPVVIDYLNAHKGHALAHLNPAKTKSPLVLIDPVQPDRNAAASLSLEKFTILVQSAKGFLAQPSPSSFEPKKINTKELASEGFAVILCATPPNGKRDVAGSKLLAAHHHIAQALKPFGIKKAGWQWEPPGTAVFYYILSTARLDETITIHGPPETLKDHAAAFRKKHCTTTVRNHRLIAIEKRTEQTPAQVLQKTLADPYILNRVKTISITSLPSPS